MTLINFNIKFAIISFIGAIIIYLSSLTTIRTNLSNSLPYKKFLVFKWPGKIDYGSYVSFYLSGYNSSFTKQVVGMPGDEINIEQDHIYVAGIYRGKILKTSPYSDTTIEPIKSGKIPNGYVFVWAPHLYSFDSRYKSVGLIAIEELKEKILPLY